MTVHLGADEVLTPNESQTNDVGPPSMFPVFFVAGWGGGGGGGWGGGGGGGGGAGVHLFNPSSNTGMLVWNSPAPRPLFRARRE